MKKLIAYGLQLTVFLTLILLALSGWFFTLIVDLSMLIVFGYSITFFIYRVLTRKWKWMGVQALLLLPTNIIALWLGGVLPYFNVIRGENVYFNLIPSHFIGVNGNDFMWNGLILPWIGRIVPLDMLPTYQYPLFTVWAVIIWLAMPLVLGWASLRGFSHSLVDAPWYKIFFPEFFKMLALAFIVFAVVSGITLGLVAIH